MDEGALNQTEMARLMGASSAYINGIICDGQMPGPKYLKALKLAMPEINLNWLITGEGQKYDMEITDNKPGITKSHPESYNDTTIPKPSLKDKVESIQKQNITPSGYANYHEYREHEKWLEKQIDRSHDELDESRKSLRMAEATLERFSKMMEEQKAEIRELRKKQEEQTHTPQNTHMQAEYEKLKRGSHRKSEASPEHITHINVGKNVGVSGRSPPLGRGETKPPP